MSSLGNILSNGFIPIIPILGWNLLFAAKLPLAYSPKTFDRGISPLVFAGERLFRFIVFLMPLSFKLNISTPIGTTGLAVYSSGVFLYFSSWLILIYLPDSKWSTSIFGFCSPAYTPLVWLIGLSLMADSYYFELPHSKLHYILPAMAFSTFHVLHTAKVHSRTTSNPTKS